MSKKQPGIGDEWAVLSTKVKTRCLQIFRPSLFFYFSVVIIGVAGLGAWLPLLRGDYPGFVEGLATGALALLAAVTIELVFPGRTLHSLKMIGYVGLVAGGLLFIVAAHFKTSLEASKDLSGGTIFLSSLPAIALSLLAWFFWILANSKNPLLLPEEPPEDAPIGGKPTSDLPGSLSGFKV